MKRHNIESIVSKTISNVVYLYEVCGCSATAKNKEAIRLAKENRHEEIYDYFVYNQNISPPISNEVGIVKAVFNGFQVKKRVFLKKSQSLNF